ncbi:MAG: type IV secretion system DNA-binding domain-containing protein [Rhodospirillaceae bacterium]|nr:type IV secretion system DNA-binding domain-containing protein [Rhodospirillaceae bacterium]
MRSFGGSTLRGGQTVFHGLHMWSQLLRAAFLLTAFGVAATPAWRVWDRTTGYEWYAAMIVTVAEVKLGMGYQRSSRQDVRQPDGTTTVLTLPEIASSPQALAMREKLKREVFGGAILGAKLSAAAIAGLLALFWLRGRQLGRNRRIRGAELATVGELRRRILPLRRRALDRLSPARTRAPYRIAGVPYPERAETQHTIVSGTTGSGKTVLISDLVAQIRERGERCVVYDKMGGYTRAFYDPRRDTLLNPLDARSPRWSPFLEARSPRDFDTMAAALIPQQKDTVDPFWVTAARQLFANGAGVLRERGVTENRVLVEHLLKTDLSKLAEAMEGTVAQSIVDPDNPKTALSVRAMLTANIGALEYLPDTGEPFSIREWISNDGACGGQARGGHERGATARQGGGFLFLTSRGDQHASLRGLISTWLEIAVNAMLSLEQNDERRIWVVLDELPTLHQVPSLQPGLAESRQFGGCFVLGVQVISALRDLYGRNGAETISGLCGTRVVLAAPDRDTAQWSAESLGGAEVEEITEGFSYGANTIRDGVSLMPKRELRPLALASEIMQLESLHGWLRFPGPLPVTRIRLNYVARPKAAERVVPRPPAVPEPSENEKAAAKTKNKLKSSTRPKRPLCDDDGPPVPRGELLLPPMEPERRSKPSRKVRKGKGRTADVLRSCADGAKPEGESRDDAAATPEPPRPDSGPGDVQMPADEAKGTDAGQADGAGSDGETGEPTAQDRDWL